MKKILSFTGVLFLLVTLFSISPREISAGELCFLCSSGSSCQQCRSNSGKDTQADRKTCEQRGCKVSGTSSCSTAANVKVCR
ncbi:MAG: hypothetical protein L6Q54_05390 [Leptospiraceae bacterium]|nr:hypothetical protein [Leptospiraceae bacterium]MCK6380672.1 hypothetical protein [Leptospiraceae bacterium]NUM41544.1 hypothetical protein [Leptospiraceae bacterium]